MYDLKPILRKLFISAYLNSLEPKVQFLCLVFLFFSEPIIGDDKGPKAVVNVLIQFSLSTKKIARLKERHFVRKNAEIFLWTKDDCEVLLDIHNKRLPFSSLLWSLSRIPIHHLGHIGAKAFLE